MNLIDIDTMDLNLMRVFEALYEEGGASRAALRLHLTQSAVSASLRRLRAIYCDPLFIRNGRGLSPTNRAHELKPQITQALSMLRQTLTNSNNATFVTEGRTVVLGLSDDFEIAVGAQLLRAIAVELPGVRIVFRQTNSKLVTDMLISHELDLALTSGGISSRTLRSATIGIGHYACLVDPSSYRGGKQISMDEYLEIDHVLISAGGFVGAVDEALSRLSKRRRVIASTTHFSALPYLLIGTRAIATLPKHAAIAIEQHTKLKMIDCPIDLPFFPIEIGWHSGINRDALISKIRDIVSKNLSGSYWS